MQNLETRIKTLEDDIKQIKAALGIVDGVPVDLDSVAVLNKEKDMRREITNMLRDIGITPHMRGYEIIRRGVIEIVRNPGLINALTKEFYPMLAKMFQTTSARIERNIRHAVESAYDRGDMDVLMTYFGNTVSASKGKPTNGEFLATIADRLVIEGGY